MNRPKLKIRLEFWDKLMEVLCFLALILLIGIPSYYYTQLPEIIPKHFGTNGLPDSYGHKGFLWVLPLIGIGIYIGLTLLNKYPHIFNYPTEITESNAARLYQTASRLLRVLKLISTALFVYILLSIIFIAEGQQDGLGTYSFIAIILVSLSITGWFFLKMMRT